MSRQTIFLNQPATVGQMGGSRTAARYSRCVGISAAIPFMHACLAVVGPPIPKQLGPVGEVKIFMLWSLTAAGLLLSLTVVVLVLRRLHTPPAKKDRNPPPAKTVPTSAWVEAGKRLRVPAGSAGGKDDDGSRDDTVDFDPDELGPDDVGGGGGGGKPGKRG
jgi:hypothetical protein